MFTLVLCFPSQGKMPRAELRITSAYVPQTGSTINTPGPRFGTWKVDHIGQDTDGLTLSDTVFVYLEETD
jgi:hypothetical protein